MLFVEYRGYFSKYLEKTENDEKYKNDSSFVIIKNKEIINFLYLHTYTSINVFLNMFTHHIK